MFSIGVKLPLKRGCWGAIGGAVWSRKKATIYLYQDKGFVIQADDNGDK